MQLSDHVSAFLEVIFMLTADLEDDLSDYVSALTKLEVIFILTTDLEDDFVLLLCSLGHYFVLKVSLYFLHVIFSLLVQSK